LQADEAIVSAAKREGHNDGNEKDDDNDHAATDRKFAHKVVNRSRNAQLSQPPRPSASRRKCASENFAFDPCRTIIAFIDGIMNNRW